MKKRVIKSFEYFGLSYLNCSEKELKKKYFQKIKYLHPDLHLSKDKFLQNKYKKVYLDVHEQYQIASMYLKKKEKETYDNTFSNNFNTYNNSNKKNNFSLFSFLNIFENIKRKNFFSIYNTRLFLVTLFVFYFFINKYNRKNKIKKKDEILLNNKTLKTNINNINFFYKNNEKKKTLSKKRYIFNVVKKDINKKNKYLNKNFNEKKKKNYNNNNIPLFMDFFLYNNRGIHNESRYINGIGGLCGGYDLIEENNKIRKKNGNFKDIIYMNLIIKNNWINKIINLENCIIYEKMKYIDISTPLKYVKHDQKLLVKLYNDLKNRNCKINLKECNFEKNIKLYQK